MGVVVVPEGFAPDGKVRIIGLKPVDADGNQSDSHVKMAWGSEDIDTVLKNYSRVPITDNAGSTSTGSNTLGCLPSDKFTDVTSFVDPKAKYCYTLMGTPFIPSPYLGNKPNPEYYKVLDSNNVLSDFNGLNNTRILVNLGSNYIATNACWNYKDGISNLQWYLPGMGELGYVMPRFNEINNAITNLKGVAIDIPGIWSSTENFMINAYYMSAPQGTVDFCCKTQHKKTVRPFAMLE